MVGGERLAIIFLSSGLQARISEPDGVFYGRIVSQVGDYEYQFTHGKLEWTIKSPIDEREYAFSTDLEPLANGRYSYRLHIPYALLAYDFDISEKALPLTASGIEFLHHDIRVDGFPVQILPDAGETFHMSQAGRAHTQQIDLLVMPDLADPEKIKDTDRDLVPDWLEERAGLDRWDATDGRAFLASLGTTANDPNTSELDLLTFEDWRQFHFPNESGDIERFASADPDNDGIRNLLEYAFMLDPKVADRGASRMQLPHPAWDEGRLAITYKTRPGVVDLDYRLTATTNLRDWEDTHSVADPVEVPPQYQGDHWRRFRGRQPMAERSLQLMRIEVSLKEVPEASR